MTTRAVLTLALLLGAAHAGAQSAPPDFPASLGESTRITLARIADSARMDGIPTEPIVAKAAEGVLKGADDTRIVAAVRALVRQLGRARAVLPSSSTGTLTAAASALRAGVTTEAIRDLAIASAGGSDADLGVALVTLVDLTTSGVSAGEAGRSVHRLLQGRAPEGAFAALRTAVAADVRAGTSPEAALSARMAPLMRDLGGGPLPPEPTRITPP